MLGRSGNVVVLDGP